MSIGTSLAMAFRRARLFAIDHEAGLEIGAGIGCFAVSVVASARAAIKSKRIMDEYNEGASRIAACEHRGTIIMETADKQQEMVQYTSENAKKDMRTLKMRTAGKLALTWTPCALGFAAGTGLVLRSHHVMVKSNLGLAAALKTAESALDEYRHRVADRYGEEAERNLYNGTEMVEVKTKEKVNGKMKTVTNMVENRWGWPLSKYARIVGRDYVERDADWDRSSNDYNHRRVKTVEEFVKNKLRKQGYVRWNEIYEAVGLKKCDDGDVFGLRSIHFGGRTDPDTFKIQIIEHLLQADPNAVSYVHDDWTDSMVRAADPFFIDFVSVVNGKEVIADDLSEIVLAPASVRKAYANYFPNQFRYGALGGT